MKCPECVEAGSRSRVYPLGAAMATLIADRTFYDEDGAYHHHDPNTTTQQYRCSEGHKWQESSRKSCWCGWPEKEATADA